MNFLAILSWAYVERDRFMKSYLLSLLVGIVAGIVYHTLDVQSPAPPTVALLGLLGILAGEQILPIGRRYFRVAS